MAQFDGVPRINPAGLQPQASRHPIVGRDGGHKRHQDHQSSPHDEVELHDEAVEIEGPAENESPESEGLDIAC